MNNPSYDLVGIGAGPFNLSLAALAEPVSEISAKFFERKSKFNWYPGLLCPDSVMQTSFLKDLVTPVDPTSYFSFLNFIVRQKRFYDFMSADFPRVTRTEYSQYLRWVSESLPSVEFSQSVESVEAVSDAFRIKTTNCVVETANLVVGTGLSPSIPRFASGFSGEDVFHASDYMSKRSTLDGKRVVVIGGGQSGADIVLDLLQRKQHSVQELTWISRRANFLPRDESAFTNEFFRPAYAQYFSEQPCARRTDLLKEQSLASNGIHGDVLTVLYQLIYKNRFLSEKPTLISLMPETEWVDLTDDGSSYNVITEKRYGGERSQHSTDVVIMCTGWRGGLPPCMEPLTGLIQFQEDKPAVKEDFSLAWAGSRRLRIFVQNVSTHAHGIAESNLSIMAWRSAVILNSIVGKRVYDTGDVSPVNGWSSRKLCLSHETDEF